MFFPGQVAQLVEHHPVHQNIVGSIPRQDKCLGIGFAPQGAHVRGNLSMFLSHISYTDVSPCFSPSLLLSLKSINRSSGEDLKKYIISLLKKKDVLREKV